MTTPQRIEQKEISELVFELEDWFSVCHEDCGDISHDKEAHKQWSSDCQEFKQKLNALLLAVQDEQKELCADYAESDEDERGAIDRDSVINSPYAYNPNKETA